jgi:hypothetical protein
VAFFCFGDIMAEPITAGLIAGLLVQELAKSSAGEAGKKLVGQLWEAIARRFQGDRRAEKVLQAVETEKSPEAEQALTVFLQYEMDDADFVRQLEPLVRQIQSLAETGKQEMATDLEVDGNLTAGDMTQRSNSREAIEQTMLKNVKAKAIDLGNLNQEQ